MTFQPGDLVVIKSGGPSMTVLKVDGEDVSCLWSEKGIHRQDIFPAVVLMPFSVVPTTMTVRRG